MAQANLDAGTVIQGAEHNEFKGRVTTQTLAGAYTLTVGSPMMQFLDPGGAGRTITLPAEADSAGLMFIIANTADAAEVLTIEDDGTNTVCTPTQNESAMVFCNGTVWKGLVGASA